MSHSLYDLDLASLEQLLVGWGYERSAARDVWRAIYSEGVTHIDELATIDAALVRRLKTEAPLRAPILVAFQEDPGGETRKDLLELKDGNCIEVVLLRYRERRSACVSTQIGCSCGCRFCATGQAGFVRDLSSGEIMAQVMHVQRVLAASGRSLTNVVLMGMGEPLLNYENTLNAVRRMTDQRGLSLPQRRITLSTVGIAPAIRRLAQEGLQMGLAVSLHAATDGLRDMLVPVNRRYPLDELEGAMRDYAARTRRRVMIEWTLIAGVNDSPEQARSLARRLDGIPAHVNLIRLNQTADYQGQPSPPHSVGLFAAILDVAGIPHTVRQRRGAAIAAGCGQLRALVSDAQSH